MLTLEVNCMSKIIHVNSIQEIAEVAIPITGGADIKLKTVKNVKGDLHKIIKDSVHQEKSIPINIREPKKWVIQHL